jgi:hypothetical protein
MQQKKIFITSVVFFLGFCAAWVPQAAAEKTAPEHIIVDGDNVEYSGDGKEVTATGHIKVNYKGAKLTCQKLSVNIITKEAVAEGGARLEDERGVIEGEKIIYNFNKKTGTIIDANFRAQPYYGKVENIEKVNDNQFIAKRGYLSTCNFDNPHYRIVTKRINFFLGDKVQTQESTFYVNRFPIVSLPRYNHSLNDKLMHVQVMPGRSKNWGPFLLTAWRYNLADNVSGRIYLDYRDKLGLAEGFGSTYDTHRFGRGDLKFYYTNEKSELPDQGTSTDFQRYFLRWRHQWKVDPRTQITAEYYKIVDAKRMNLGTDYNVLKDYFPREYEKDAQPLSYILMHHAFTHSSLDFIVQKRTNRWYEQLEKLPEVKYSLPNIQIGETPFYFENNTQAAHFNYKYPVPSSSVNDIRMDRLDMTNKVSLPMRAAFVHLTPWMMNRETFYDKDVYGSAILPRTVFYTGIDASTKFYRNFDVSSNFLGMDINGLRHVITPTVKYAYNHTPTILSSKLKQIDTIDAIGLNNGVSLELSNKLQTKRKDQVVTLADVRVTSGYTFYQVDPTTNGKSGGDFNDFLVDMELCPYSWLRVDADATYDNPEGYFSTANYSFNFDIAKERSIGFGQRYLRKGTNELTASLAWRLTPKWKFSMYQRYNIGHDPAVKRGWREQEYVFSRDMHCWIMDFSYNIKEGEGSTVWWVFRLKAFPEVGFGLNQSYYSPQSGARPVQ